MSCARSCDFCTSDEEVDMEELVICGETIPENLLPDRYHCATLKDRGVSIRYKILGAATENSIPIIFTPGGMLGMREASHGVCIHPTLVYDKKVLEDEYLNPAKPQSKFTQKLRKTVATHLCYCALLGQKKFVWTCRLEAALRGLIGKLNKGRGKGEGSDNTSARQPNFFVLLWDRRNTGASSI
eukprot:Cvel_10196.t1-p1 / transcript=Cvel_10196.t1 / gene=Cvel_10196 / organism=Chromera_velia_CCMP2878 / gene_product=hypothetical protein / transcript_product=hypothetical protein / location=Cvel_scaffold610:50-600(-) / protein_length=183 / sequence_SO=supercontig / SO=protein_coding / is_pseudo=false